MTGVVLSIAFLTGMVAGEIGVAVVFVVAVLFGLRRSGAVAVAAFAVVLSVLGCLRATDVNPTLVLEGSDVSGIGTVISQPAITRVGQHFSVAMVDQELGMVTLCATTANQPLVRQGDSVRIEGASQALSELSANRQSALLARGCDGLVEPKEVIVIQGADGAPALINNLRDHIAELFHQVAPGDSGALMTGLLIGDDSALTFESQEAFLSTGTTHITAVSGANFAILVTIASMIAGTSGARRKWGWILIVAVSIWTYAVLVGLPPSAVRAAFMATMALLAARFGRIPDFLTLLMITVILQLIVRPADLHTLSFQLSVSATLALILVFSGWRRGRRAWPLAIVLSALAAHLATIPVLAWQLGEIPMMSIPANSAISPLVLVAFPLVAASALFSLLSTGLATVIALPAAYLSSGILTVVTWFQSLSSDTSLTGEMPIGVFIGLTALCWGVIALMSFDCRVVVSQLSRELREVFDHSRVRR